MSPVLNEDAAARRAVRPMPRALPTRVELRTREVIASEADARAAALREAYAPPSTGAPTVAPPPAAPAGATAPGASAPTATPTPRAKGLTAKEKRAAARAEAAAAARAAEERYLRLRAGLSVAPTGAAGGVMHCGKLVPSYEGRFLNGADHAPMVVIPAPAAYPPIPRARPAMGYGPSVRP